MFLLRYSALILFILASVCASAQRRDTFYLKTTTSAYIESERATRSFPKFKDFAAWTTKFSSGNTGTGRSLIKFDLPKVEADSLIAATLFLYHNGDTKNLGQTLGNNAAYLKPVTQDWGDTTVTWNNQPNTTFRRAISLPFSTKANQDYRVNMFEMTRFFLEEPDSNHGLMIALQDETIHRAMKFASENAVDSSLQPVLRIIVRKEIKEDRDTLRFDSCMVIGSSNGLVDSYIQDDIPDENRHLFPDFACWTTSFKSGTVGTGRSLMSFEVPETPDGMQLSKAYLNLFHSNSSNLGHYGNNAASLKRITSKWEVDKVTWNNQPATTDTNQVKLSKSEIPNQDYGRIDITQLVRDQVVYSSRSFGLLLSLNREEKDRSMKFASTNHTDSTRQPFIEFCYSLYTHNESAEDKRLRAYPNPGSNRIAISLPSLVRITAYQLVSIDGKLVITGVARPNEEMLELDVSTLPKGLYLFRLKHRTEVLKLMIKP